MVYGGSRLVEVDLASFSPTCSRDLFLFPMHLALPVSSE